MTDPKEMRIMGVYLTGKHPYSFRCGQRALITGVKSISSAEYPMRVCYEVTFPDGFVDYVPLCDMQNYEIEGIQ